MRRLIGVMSLFVISARLDDGRLILATRPAWRRPRCGECGQRAPGYDRKGEPRLWRALSYGSIRVFLEYALRRVDCGHCGGVRVEQVPWAVHGSWFTKAFEELVAYHAQVTDKTTVTKLLGISWEAVGRIVERVVSRSLDENRLHAVTRIGIDEFSYRKRHKYLTIVVDHDTKRVIWASKGKGADALSEFFDKLGADGIARLKVVTLDMAGGYMKAVKERAPHAQLIFDRFHVQALASTAVDEVRRELWRSLKGTEAAADVKGMRFILLKNARDLTRRQRRRLAVLERANRPLYRAYLLKEGLAAALNYRQPKRAEAALDEWLAWASRSKLEPFVKVARTIRRHKEGVLAYVRHRLTNAVVEGFNTRLRMIARRSFGFHSPGALISMIFLCVGGIELTPPLPSPTQP